MDRVTKRVVCIGLVCVFLCLVVGCAVDSTQKQPLSAKTKAQLRQEREAKAAARTEAKRAQKARAAEELKAKREAAVKAKREAAAKAKAKRAEQARAARLNAEARKQAKVEIAQAAREKKSKLAALDAKAKKEAKTLAGQMKAERASLKRKYDQDKARIAAEHKRAKARITKQEKKRLDAEHKRTLSRLKAEYTGALAKLDEKAKAQAKQSAQATSRKKAELAQLTAEPKKVRAQQANLKAKLNKDKAEAAAGHKRAKARITKQEKKRLDAEYKRTLSRLKGEYNGALARLAERAKAQTKQCSQARSQKKAELAQLTADGKKLAKDVKAQKASLKSQYSKDKARIAAEHKQARAAAKKRKATKNELARLDAQYKDTLSRRKAEYDSACAKLKRDADAKAADIKQAKAQKKAEFPELDAKAKKQAKDIKAERASLKREYGQDKREAANYGAAKLSSEYKQKVSQLEAAYKKDMAQVKEDADARAADIKQAKAQKKAELAELDAETKEQAKDVKAERARLKRVYEQDKREAGKYGLVKVNADYKQKLNQLNADYKEDLAKLEEKPKTEYAEKKKQIEDEYKQAVARAKLRVRHQKEKALVEQLKLPADETPRLTAKELRISGNTLISTDEILEKMPAVYNASDEPLEQAESKYLYDLRVLHDIVLDPGRPRQVSAWTIQGLTQYVVSVYQDEDYAGIYVYVPKEAVGEGGQLQDGILPVVVLEAKVTGVTAKSYDPNQTEVEKGYLSKDAVLEWSPVQPGEVANQKELDDFVNLLNLNPDRYVSAVVTQGAEEGSLAVAYDIYEAEPWHWFIQADNSGTRDRQWAPRSGLINTDLLGVDDTFTAIYQAPWDKEIGDDYSVYGSYDFPLMGPRLRLNLYGGYSQFDVTPEAGDVDFIGNGDFYGGILRYNVLQTDSWFFDITGSLSHERSKVTPSLFPTILGTDVRFWLWGAGVNLHRSDDMSNSSLAFNRYESMGGESSGSEFALARTNAKSAFSIYSGSAAHSQFMDPNKIGRFSSTFRWVGSNERLVPAKMTTFGGMYTVRGYDEYEVVADGGILASAQYEFDLVKYDESKQIGKPRPEQAEAEAEMPFVRKLAPLVFFDYGRSKVRHPISTEHGQVEMFSVGGGVVLELGDNFSGGVYYGYPLAPTDDTRTGNGRLNVGVMVRW